MGGFFSADNWFFSMINKVVDCIFLGLLWLLFCIPIVTAGASTTALYYTVNKAVKNGQGYIWQCFFHSFKDNLKQATLIWIVMIALGLIFAEDAYIMKENVQNGLEFGKLYPVFYALIGFEVMLAMYIFSYLARFANTTKNIVKNSVFMCFAHFPKTLVCATVLVAGGFAVYLVPVLILVIPVVVIYLWNGILEKIFMKYMSEEDRKTEEEKRKEFY